MQRRVRRLEHHRSRVLWADPFLSDESDPQVTAISRLDDDALEALDTMLGRGGAESAQDENERRALAHYQAALRYAVEELRLCRQYAYKQRKPPTWQRRR
jgi:hypothetical protein